jgi:hypothetical protein
VFNRASLTFSIMYRKRVNQRRKALGQRWLLLCAPGDQIHLEVLLLLLLGSLTCKDFLREIPAVNWQTGTRYIGQRGRPRCTPRRSQMLPSSTSEAVSCACTTCTRQSVRRRSPHSACPAFCLFPRVSAPLFSSFSSVCACPPLRSPIFQRVSGTVGPC